MTTPTHPKPTHTVSGLGTATHPNPHDDDAPQRPPALKLDPRTYNRALDCVQCGLCLPACPTYITTGLETDSPRGRIRLIKALADGRIELTPPVAHHLDLCLDCHACETACPSGVVYHELIEETRTRLTSTPPSTATPTIQTLADKLVRAITLHVLPYPPRLKLVIFPARLLQKLRLWQRLTKPPISRVIPTPLLKMMRTLPTQSTLWEPDLDHHYPAADAPDATRKATASLFTGCIGSVLFQDINRQAIDLLRHARCDVAVPRTQLCCGALHHHAGHVEHAKALARANIDAFLKTAHTDQPHDQYIVNHIAGCGAMLKQYPHLLRDDPVYADRARDFASRVRDISELLVTLDPPRPTHLLPPHLTTATYHDPCHLAHAQQVVAPPRQVLSWIENLTLTPLPESDMCCGAAGSYNLTQPAMAAQLGQRKVQRIQETNSRVCVTGNVGCAMQIKSEAERLGTPLTVLHPVTLLHKAYFGTPTVPLSSA